MRDTRQEKVDGGRGEGQGVIGSTRGQSVYSESLLSERHQGGITPRCKDLTALISLDLSYSCNIREKVIADDFFFLSVSLFCFFSCWRLFGGCVTEAGLGGRVDVTQGGKLADGGRWGDAGSFGVCQ